MRRAERVVTDETRIAAVIEDCKVCRIGLALLMRHTAGEGDYSFPDAALDRVTVFSIEASTLSCKENQ